MTTLAKKFGIVLALITVGIATTAAHQFTNSIGRNRPHLSGDVRTFSVLISPQHSVPSNTYCVFTATVSGGTAPFSYAWYVNNSPVGGDSPNLGYTSGNSGFRIQVFVTDATSAQTNDSKIITVGGSSC